MSLGAARVDAKGADAEAASLGQRQRKLFLDTTRACAEPDNFILVDTDDAIALNSDKQASFAVVEVAEEGAKYADLKAVDGAALHALITENQLSIHKGVFLFFNRRYKRRFLDVFLDANGQAQAQEVPYFCRDFRAQQRAHIQKILKLDFGVERAYGAWFLDVYDRHLLGFDANDCYELLAANLSFWKELILNDAAVKVCMSP